MIIAMFCKCGVPHVASEKVSIILIAVDVIQSTLITYKMKIIHKAYGLISRYVFVVVHIINVYISFRTLSNVLSNADRLYIVFVS